jgi:general secretion pathway protein H
MKNDQSGFSLVELLIAIAILAAIVSVAPIVTRSSGSAAADRAAAYRLVTELKVARSSALRRNQPEAVDFDATSRRFAVVGGREAVVLPNDVSVTVVSARAADAESGMRIVFFPDGSSSGGTILLTSPRGQNVIGIDWLSGRVGLRN